MLKFNFQQKASQTPTNRIYKSKKRPNSSKKYQKTPDIITQVKPIYLNNFIKPVNPHQLAFTPTNHSNLLQNKKFLLPNKSKEFINKKTLILDLDETLVHSSFKQYNINIPSDIIMNINFENEKREIHVLIRPGVKEFLERISKRFEIIIFTASLSKYASPLIDILDNNNLISYRLFRQHCTFVNGVFVKDLNKLNRKLEDLILLDNSPFAYMFHNNNGFPIKTWYDDKSDRELYNFSPIIEFLSYVPDVRKVIP